MKAPERRLRNGRGPRPVKRVDAPNPVAGYRPPKTLKSLLEDEPGLRVNSSTGQPRVPAGSPHGGEWTSGHGPPSGLAKTDSVLNAPDVLKTLKVPEVMYHVAPEAAVQSILDHGLKVADPDKRNSTAGYSFGVYLTDSPHSLGKSSDVHTGKMVVLAVSTKGLNLRLDPEFYFGPDTKAGAKYYVEGVNVGAEQYALYSPTHVPPSHVEAVGPLNEFRLNVLPRSVIVPSLPGVGRNPRGDRR